MLSGPDLRGEPTNNLYSIAHFLENIFKMLPTDKKVNDYRYQLACTTTLIWANSKI